MANQTTEVITGGVVLAAAVGFFLYASDIVGQGGTGVATPYTASFSSVEGISVGTDVRLGGVKVGTVTALDLNPQTFRAEAEFTVSDDIKLPEDTAILISSEGLLGGSFVELMPGGSPFELEPGSEIEDTQSSVSLVTLLMRIFAGDGGA